MIEIIFVNDKIMTDVQETDSIAITPWFVCLVLSMIIGFIGIIMTSIFIHRIRQDKDIMIKARTWLALMGLILPLTILLIPVATIISSIVFNYAIQRTSDESFYRVIVAILATSICLFILYIASSSMMNTQISHKASITSINIFVYTCLAFDVLCLMSFISSDEKRIRFFF